LHGHIPRNICLIKNFGKQFVIVYETVRPKSSSVSQELFKTPATMVRSIKS